VGYLATYLASPIGQAQLTAQVYGAVVDELTEEQASSVRVPVCAYARSARPHQRDQRSCHSIHSPTGRSSHVS
jgi:hypothetical protein